MIFTLIAFAGITAQAQSPNPLWLNLSYTFNDFKYSETDVNQAGKLPGGRGEFGIRVMSWLSLSAAGSYMNGHLDYDGKLLESSTREETTSGYQRDLRYLAHINYFPLMISTGAAERLWYDDPSSFYRRHSRYEYHPVLVTLFTAKMYFTFEYDVFKKAKAKVNMADLGGGRQAVEFKLGDADGLGGEIGYLIPSGGYATRVFVRYHKWNFKTSDTQNDGVGDLVIPSHEITLLQAGIGLDF